MKSLCTAILFCSVSAGFAFEPVIERAPTFYSDTEPDTPLTRIEDRIGRGEKLLCDGSDTDILHELLDLLGVPVESQVFVYSKTSAQNSRISPETPRAIYFSDNAYVGWVQGGGIEVTTFDEKLGAVFHFIQLPDRKPKAAPKMVRDKNCLSCHAASPTGGFPGSLVRSVFPDETGQPIFQAGTFRTDDSSPIEERWGGWYVTGQPGNFTHMGNIVASEEPGGEVSVRKIVDGPIQDLSKVVNCEPYLGGGTSDIVALMVLEHQVRVHNILTEANITVRQLLHRDQEMKKVFGEPQDAPLSETNQRILDGQVEKVVDALLFRNEFQMGDDGVDGGSEFQKAFQAGAKQDRDLRSLRDLRLYERLFKYRCSYVIYSDVFQDLPDKVRKPILNRLCEILTFPDSYPEYSYLGHSECEKIRQILTDTLPEWPENKDNSG